MIYQYEFNTLQITYFESSCGEILAALTALHWSTRMRLKEKRCTATQKETADPVRTIEPSGEKQH